MCTKLLRNYSCFPIRSICVCYEAADGKCYQEAWNIQQEKKNPEPLFT